MAYNGLINRNLALAFRLLKDLVQPATFSVKTDVAFDFDNVVATSTGPTTKDVMIVEVSSTRRQTDKTSETREILYKSIDMPNSSVIDNITYDGNIWNVDRQLNGQGPVTYLRLVRSGYAV